MTPLPAPNAKCESGRFLKVTSSSALAEVLGKEVWPADRDQLVAKAQEAHAADRVLADLRRLPAGQQFENVQDVARALGIGTEQQRF